MRLDGARKGIVRWPQFIVHLQYGHCLGYLQSSNLSRPPYKNQKTFFRIKVSPPSATEQINPPPLSCEKAILGWVQFRLEEALLMRLQWTLSHNRRLERNNYADQKTWSRVALNLGKLVCEFFTESFFIRSFHFVAFIY